MKFALAGIWAGVMAILASGAGSPAAAQRTQPRPTRPPTAAAPTTPAASTPAATTTPGTATTPATTPAAGAAPSAKIAYIDSRRLLQQTPGYAAAESTFAKELATYRQEVSKLQASLDSSASNFEQQSVVLNPTQRTTKRKELETQQQTLEKRSQELQQRAATRERELLSPIQQRVQVAIEALRMEDGYAIIFDVTAAGGSIVTADKSLDLTDRVLERLKASK